MIILGIYGGLDWDANKSVDDFGDRTWLHDSGATLFVNGKHICSITEERLSRIKYDGNYPINSIDYCLSVGNIDAEDVDKVYLPSMYIPIFYVQFHAKIGEKILKEKFPNAEIKLLSHHLSHAASAIFSSDFNDGCFITLDGAGSAHWNYYTTEYLDQEVSTIGYFNKEKNIFRMFNSVIGHNTFGINYSNLSREIYCQKIGKYIDADDEKHRESWSGKVMGLSAYGKDLQLTKELKLYRTSKELFYEDVPSVILANRFSDEDRYNLSSPEQKAYILQKNTECGILDYVIALKEKGYLEDNTCFSGGVFLNVLVNSLLKKSGLFKRIHIPPCTSDTGLHFGAACYGAFQSKETIELPHNIALLGKEYSDDEIKNALDEKNLQYKKYDDFEELCGFTAKQLNDQKIIAWFQGRSEFGPRALGSRSLLMHPGPAENKDIMNERVKHREYWRPFAGIILEEYLTEYFNEDFNSPYMLYSLTVKEEKMKELGAITHKDNTCRIQTVNNKINEKITTLLNKFKEETSIPAVLNTSFNDNGEPIVESPQDAVRSFLNMNIDYLVIGNYVVTK